MLEKIQETAAYLQSVMKTKPETAIILGTGLGSLVNEITEKYEVEYKDIPNFPLSTVEGHSGKLIFGKLGNKDIMAMQGRFHYYEGYTAQQVVFPVRVMKLLGIKTLFVSNAAGSMNSTFRVGDVMVINDHINLIPNPLIGRNIDELGRIVIPKEIRKKMDIKSNQPIEIYVDDNKIILCKYSPIGIT